MRILEHISTKEKILFARSLAVMAQAGLPLLQSLQMIRKQVHGKLMARIIDETIHDVSNGQFLATSLTKYQHIFGNFFVNIVRIGETSGTLSENLNYLVQELTKSAALKGKIISALLYPFVILLATLGITGFLVVFIFPKILPVFKSLNVTLPSTTQFLITLSVFLTTYGLWVLLSAVVIIVLLGLVVQLPKVKFLAHRVLLMLPLFGSMLKAYTMANFSRTLAILLKSGVTIVEAIHITSNTMSNMVYQQELRQCGVVIHQGRPFSTCVSERTSLFPPLVASMINVGEETGNLSESLFFISTFYESELDDTTRNLSTILEPALMVFMGAMVGFVAISIITPIYQVGQAINR